MKKDKIFAKEQNRKQKIREKQNRDQQDRRYPNSFWMKWDD